MPHELDRIKQLAGLQQEAAVSLKGKESALKAWYNKYSKYTGGNGDPLPFGLIKAYTESGIISDGYEENELAKAEKALGKKEGDWEDQDWQKVYSMTPITQGMEQDLLKITGSKTIDEELLAKVYDVIEDMYPSYDQVLGKKESAVQEAPASGDQAKVQALLTWFTNKYNEYKQALINQEKENGNKNIQAYLDNNDELGELEEIISSLKTGNMQQAIDSINDAKFEFSGIPGDGDDFFQLLNKLGIPKKTFWFGETAAQPVNSSVDDTIQRARAQIESLESQLKEDYKKFQGMKPYKPKKK